CQFVAIPGKRPRGGSPLGHIAYKDGGARGILVVRERREEQVEIPGLLGAVAKERLSGLLAPTALEAGLCSQAYVADGKHTGAVGNMPPPRAVGGYRDNCLHGRVPQRAASRVINGDDSFIA